MSEPINTTEVENALSAIFTKVDAVENSVIDLTAKNADTNALANHALNVAKAAKQAIKEIRTVPTNSHDVFLGVLGKSAKVAVTAIIVWGIVKCFQAYHQPLVIREAATNEPQENEDNK